MILVLKDADFSANNVGHVEVPYELSSLTKSYLSHVTKYDEDSPEAISLDVFLNTLITAGIYEKIKVLCLPKYASSIAECFYDLKRNVDISPVITTELELRTKGIGIKETVTEENDLFIRNIGDALGTIGSQLSLSIGIYYADAEYATAVNSKLFGIKTAPYIEGANNKCIIGYQSNAHLKIFADTNHIGSIGLRSLSYDGNNEIHINYCGLSETSVTKEENFTTPVNLWNMDKFTPFGYNFGPEVNQNTVSMIYLGNYLTPSELEILTAAASILMA